MSEELCEELYCAFIAGFRASAEGFNGECTGRNQVEAWDEEIMEDDELQREFSAWLEGREKPCGCVSEQEEQR